MSKKLYEEDSVRAIANAIREKNGEETSYKVSQMAQAILDIDGGGGGSTNILSGTEDPRSSQGDNGTVYLKYYEPSLPSGYTELENIQSTGTQYIDTGVNATSDIAVEIDFEDADLGGGDPVLYGMRLSWSQMLGINNGGNQSDTNIMYLYYDGNGNAGQISEMMSAVIKLENGKRTVDGVETSFTQTSFSYNYPIFIFAANSSGSPSNYSRYKLNNLKIWDAGTLIRNFVPAKRDSDDTIGLYDTINNTFYTNAGSGSFSAGLEREQGIITDSKLKVSGAWQNLIGSNIDDVETGGGGESIPVILEADWNAMTTAQKQSYGLCVIQTASSGFRRGIYVNGADYIPLDIYYTGTAKNNASASVDLANNAKLIVIAMNSEASTKQLETSAALDGTALSGIDVSFNSYAGSGTNRRNYRITAFDIAAGSHDLSISLTTDNNDSSFVYIVLAALNTTIDKELTTPDAATTGTNNHNGIVIFGTFDGGTGGTILAEKYFAEDSVSTPHPGSSYKSSYIFWFV